MNISMAFNMALKSIASNKARSFLTMLGIIIGVGSVIILISVVQGVTDNMTAQLNSMGTNLVSVNIRGRGATRTVDMSDISNFIENSEYFEAVSPTVSSSVTVKYLNNNITSSIIGTNEFYKTIRNTDVQSGRFISELDVDKRQKVALIGTYQVEELFEGANPLNEKIKLNGDLYTVIGVLEQKSNSTQGSTDDRIIIPYTTAMRLVRNQTISSYSLQAASSDTIEQSMLVLQQFLYKTLGNTEAFTVSNQAEMIETAGEMTGKLTAMLGGIAGISLIVGGIGIMNIMLVSVTERTREIGIRKSIGAKRRSILIQFLIESIVVSCMGGVVGIILGIVLGNVIGNALGVVANATLLVVLGSFGFSAFVGIFFGWYPANKASKLNPIEALRFE